VVPIFGYGSNNVEQLRGRLEEPALQEFPAVLPGYVRVFGGPNASWSVGGRLGDGANSRAGKVSTASLLAQSGGQALGNIVLLDRRKLKMLHGFEGYPNVYTMITVDVVLRGPDGYTAPFPAQAYTRVRTDFVGDGPSEAYLCACLRTAKQSFPEHPADVKVLDATGRERRRWTHPGFANLTLPAFLYEVGARKSPPWKMPLTVTEVVEKLESVGVPITIKPAELLRDIDAINDKLVRRGKKAIAPNTVNLAKELLQTASYRI